MCFQSTSNGFFLLFLEGPLFTPSKPTKPTKLYLLSQFSQENQLTILLIFKVYLKRLVNIRFLFLLNIYQFLFIDRLK